MGACGLVGYDIKTFFGPSNELAHVSFSVHLPGHYELAELISNLPLRLVMHLTHTRGYSDRGLHYLQNFQFVHGEGWRWMWTRRRDLLSPVHVSVSVILRINMDINIHSIQRITFILNIGDCPVWQNNVSNDLVFNH